MTEDNFDVATILSQSTFLSALSSRQLEWMIQNGRQFEVETGTEIITENVNQDGLYIILTGAFEIIRQAGETELVIDLQKSGQILGEMSLIANLPPTATVRAACPSRVFMIGRETLNSLLLEQPSVGIDLMRTAMKRLRRTETMLYQNEKLASLGNLAAGLAHELNNPAAAARRSSGQLRQAIDAWMDARIELDALLIKPDQKQTLLARLRSDVTDRKSFHQSLDPLALSDLEQEMEDWLQSMEVIDTWEIAPALIDFGWTPENLEAWCEQFPHSHVPAILRWLIAGYLVFTLMSEIDQSVERISGIVTAVKSYTYLDQAPKKSVNIHEGLESTLIILKHKTKNITIQRKFDLGLPHLLAYAGELNQVWTNLIDNAIDAMQGSGTLRLITYQQADQLVVEIGDNGPGIPDGAIVNLFEPFYTTKGPGKGTGLGLYVSYSIIKKHGGKITVDSRPGDTRFIVTIPYHITP